MDIATLIGIVAAFGLVVGSILMGSGLSLFINVPSLLIVVGGTMGVSLINYPLKEILGIAGVIKNAFFCQTQQAAEIIATLVDFAGKGENFRSFTGVGSKLSKGVSSVSDDPGDERICFYVIDECWFLP